MKKAARGCPGNLISRPMSKQDFPKLLIYTSQVLRGEAVFFFIGKTHTLKNIQFWHVFERNPLMGSAPARHLEPDALILTRVGGLRGRISYTTCFLITCVPYFGPKTFRAQIVHGNFGQVLF